MKILHTTKKDINNINMSKIEMSIDDMELFFQKSLTSVRSRPKRLRKDSKMIRFAQKNKINQLEDDLKNDLFFSAKKFLKSVLVIGCSDEGTPV